MVNNTNGSTSDDSASSSQSSNRGNQEENHLLIAEYQRNNDVTVNSNTDANQETSEESDAVERFLVAYCRSSKLGAAYYTLQTGELFILNEIVDRAPEFQMFLNLYRQVEPVRVLLDGKTQGSFVTTVKAAVFASGSDGNAEGRCKLEFVSAKDYSFEACKRRIFSLSLPHEPPDCTDKERTMFLCTVVDFSQTQSVHALGALLRFLDLNWSNLNMDMQGKPQFLSLKKISLADIVTIDGDTYRGLQIFSTVSHPSNFKKGVQGSHKEGFSLFQLFSKCSSKVGQSRLKVLFQHPTTDLTTLKRRQDVVAFFMRPESDSIMRNICSCLRYIKNVNWILVKIKALSAKPYQWKSLYNTVYKAVQICKMCEIPGRAAGELFEQLAARDNDKLCEMAMYMNRIIDFDLSKSESKFTVKAGVDAELDMKKQMMASLHGLMSETAKVELERLPPFVEECSMLYMPHLGYMLGVKAWQDHLNADEIELPNMKFMFQNNDYIHYKSKGCEELDVKIGDTYPEIVEHETKIMMRLTALLLQDLCTLAAVIEQCAELDCLIAISKVCKEHNFVRPTLTTDKILSIKQGRHPLHSLSNDSFVPNDAESSQAAGCVKILTGPNSSGKSVYMKQIGLIVYLAHIGSFVPAEAATIGIMSHVYSRLQSTECVAEHMSAFLIDLRQMALALQESSSNSLLIVDEFGKGTSQADGLALLAACLNTLLYQDEECPHVLLSTHFLNIHEFIVHTPNVKFLRLEHMIQDGEPVFLFRLAEGRAPGTIAHSVAAGSGIEGRAIRRAQDVMACLMNNSLPPENKKITAKLRAVTELIKNELLTDDI